MHTNRCGKTSRQECHAKRSTKETKIQEFMYGGTTNMVHEMYDNTTNNWSQRHTTILRRLNYLLANQNLYLVDRIEVTRISTDFSVASEL
jgi:hypothetical protein